MLNRLPNEMLCKILAKTKRETSRNCRLLNSRFDEIITKDQLHKNDVDELIIFGFRNGEEIVRRARCVFKIEGKNRYQADGPYVDYDDCLKNMSDLFVKKIRSVTALKLQRAYINTQLMQILMEIKCFLKLTSICVEYCRIDMNIKDKWFYFLNKLHLNELHIFNRLFVIPVPEMMILRVKIYKYQGIRMGQAVDMEWFDDNVLNNWYSNGKELKINSCQTSLTIRGIIKCIQKYPQDSVLFGIIKNRNLEVIENALRNAQMEWDKRDAFPNFNAYSVNRMGDRKIRVNFKCRK